MNISFLTLHAMVSNACFGLKGHSFISSKLPDCFEFELSFWTMCYYLSVVLAGELCVCGYVARWMEEQVDGRMDRWVADRYEGR
jgi:hypothetical protein